MTVSTEIPTNGRPRTLREMMDAKHVPAPERKDDTLDVVTRLASYMAGGENRSAFIRAIVFRLVSVVALITIPFLTGQAIEVLSSPDGGMRQLSSWAVLGLISTLVFLGFAFVAERSFAHLATGGLYRLQRALFDHIQELSLSYFDRQPIGELMSRVTNDTETVALFYEQAVAQIVRAIFQIVLIFLVMVLVDWRLTSPRYSLFPSCSPLRPSSNGSPHRPSPSCKKNWANLAASRRRLSPATRSSSATGDRTGPLLPTTNSPARFTMWLTRPSSRLYSSFPSPKP